MRVEQLRQWPRNSRNETIGTLSYGLMGAPHCGQCEDPKTTDSLRGRRYATTFKNEPNSAPKMPANVTSIRGHESAATRAGLSPPCAEAERALHARRFEPASLAPRSRPAAATGATSELPAPAFGAAAVIWRRARPHDRAAGAVFDRERIAIAGGLRFDDVPMAFSQCFGCDEFGRALVFEGRLDRLQFADAHPGVGALVVRRERLRGRLRGA